jgi:hypothetical protein
MKSIYFTLQELVPPEVYSARGEKAWELLDPRLIETIDAIWAHTGAFVVNDWHKGGSYKESGLRSAGTSTGAQYSQHKRGCGVDAKHKTMTVKELFDFIMANQHLFPHLTCIEDIASTPTWLHLDCRNPSWEGIRIVKP